MVLIHSLFFHLVSFFDTTSESKSNTPSSLTADIYCSVIVYSFIHSRFAFFLLPQLNQNLKLVLIASLVFYPRYIVVSVFASFFLVCCPPFLDLKAY